MGTDDVGCSENTAEAETAAVEEIYEALPDLGQRLGIRPRSFRMYLDHYSDLLPVHEVGEERALTSYSVSFLEQIHRRTQEGFSEEEIRAELLEEAEPVIDDDGEVDPPDSRARKAEEQLMEVLHDLQGRLERSEERRVEDRDKLMMMLMRTQRELQQMRYELARTGRRQRHRSLWDRVLGR